MITFEDAFSIAKRISSGYLWLSAAETKNHWIFQGTFGNYFADMGNMPLVLDKDTGEEVFTGGSGDPDGVRRVCGEVIRVIELCEDPIDFDGEEYDRPLKHYPDDLPEAFKEAVRKQQKGTIQSI